MDKASSQPVNAPELVTGFTDQVANAQQTFRLLLKAMSEPGVIQHITEDKGVLLLSPAAFAACQMLLDQSTSLWLAPEFDLPGIRKNLAFHTGTKFTGNRVEANFALCTAETLLDLSLFSRGSAEYPETNCTMLLQTAQLGNEISGAIKLRLSGPGISSTHLLSINTLSAAVLDYLQKRPDPFPLGLDLIITAGCSMVCIPRTTHVEVLSCM